MGPFLKEAWNVIARLTAAYGAQVLGGLVIIIVGLLVALWAGRAARRLAERSERLGTTIAPVLSKAARVLVLAITLVAVLEKLGVDTTSIIAALGALGLGVGLALKDTLADLAAGIVLLVLRPFDAGHDVEIAGVDGHVLTIDLFETKLIGTDGVPVMVANKKIRNERIRNFSRAERRRVDITVGVAYGANIDQAIACISEVVASDERALKEPAPIINAVDLADSSVNILVRVNLTPAGWFATQLDLRRQFKLAFDRAGIEIPYPQLVVHKAAA